jgi:hypothetical protein
MSVLSNSNAIPSGGGGYTMTDSLRLRQSASASFSRTPSSAGNRRTWTWSAWVKRGKLNSSDQSLFDATGSGNVYHNIRFISEKIYITMDNNYGLSTNAVFRDPTSWYHIVVANDTTQATASNRIKIWINGVQQSYSFWYGTYPSLNFEGNINGGSQHSFGKYIYGNTQYFDGYMTEVNFVDGQALTPTDFGEYGEETGAWQAKAYTGTYGSNGYYLDMSTSGSTITDQSGNGNNWTASNMNLTTSSATTYDIMSDVPTLTDEDTGNFATLNVILPNPNSGTMSEANLSWVGASHSGTRGTFGMTSGKWYWEVTNTSGSNNCIGISQDQEALGLLGGDSYGWGYYGSGLKYTSGSGSSYGASYTTNDVIGVAFDADAGSLVFYKNGVSQGTAYTGLTSAPYYPAISSYYGTVKANFGQRPFAHTPPTGYKKLNTYNLPDSAVFDGSQHFFPKLFTGTGSTLTVSGLEFSPDWVWFKQRGKADYHQAYDTLRGVARNLSINQTVAQQNSGTSGLTAFNSDGFTIGTWNNLNQSGVATVAWCWRASDSAPVSNTDGTRTSTVSTNTDAGFSIVDFNSGSSSFTVGHGLGTTPAMLIMKDYTSTTNWAIWHKGLSNLAQNWLQFDTNGENGNSTAFNNTAPNSSVVSLSNSYLFNSNQDCIMYAFAEVEGFSKFGTYTANSSTDGPFVYTGFKPAFVMVKARNMGQEWVITDSERGSYNVNDKALFPNNSNSESTSNAVDYLSNGFKIRTAGDGTNYNSGQTYIYVAFAENPFKNSLAR